MSANPHGSLAIYYEHPDWFRPLFEELDRRAVPYIRLRAQNHCYDPAELRFATPVVFNRMSPSAYLRGSGNAVFYTTQFLAHLRRLGVRVINGLDAWQVEISKAAQLSLLERMGVRYPRSRVISDPAEAGTASAGLRFPVVLKPNIGGSGAGIRRFDTPEALEAAAASGSLDLGIDRTALVQEYIRPDADRIVRVEVLNGQFVYAIRIYTTGETFDLCPADVCQSVDGAQLERAACPADAPRNGLRVEAHVPPPDIVETVERIAAAAGIEIGGVEYLIDPESGQPVFYDVNALSNFVADPLRVLGFDPVVPLVDWLEAELAASKGAVAEVA